MKNFYEYINHGKKLININIDEALTYFENLKKKFPFKEETLFELGKIYYIKQNFKLAKQNLELIKNNNYHLNLLLAKTYKSLNQNFLAIKLLLKLYKQNKNDEIENEIINLFLTLKKDLLAIKFLLKNNKQNQNLNNIIKFYINNLIIENAKNNFENIKKELLRANDIFNKYSNNTEYLKEKNILLNEYEIGTKQIKLKSKPRNLTVTLTNKCNLKCKMCKNVKETPFDLNDRYFYEIKQLLPFLQRVVWIGGEVFLYKNFFELFNLSNKYNIPQNISTNAILLNEHIISKLIQAPYLELNLSIDALTKEIYENIRVGAKIEQLLVNLNLLKKLITNKENVKLYLNVVISKWNLKENFLNYINFCKDYNIKQICFSLDMLDLFNAKIINNFNNNFRKQLEQQFKKLNIECIFLVPLSISSTTNHDYIETTLKQTCLQPWKTIMIDCTSVRLGDLCPEISQTHNDSLLNIWNNNCAINFRKQLLEYSNTKCKNICSNNILNFNRFKT